jgi:hypothetical protein
MAAHMRSADEAKAMVKKVSSPVGEFVVVQVISVTTGHGEHVRQAQGYQASAGTCARAAAITVL